MLPTLTSASSSCGSSSFGASAAAAVVAGPATAPDPDPATRKGETSDDETAYLTGSRASMIRLR